MGGDSRDAARAGSEARVRWRRAVPPPAPLPDAGPSGHTEGPALKGSQRNELPKGRVWGGLPRARKHFGCKAPPERVHVRTVPGGSGRSQTTTRRQLFIANL